MKKSSKFKKILISALLTASVCTTIPMSVGALTSNYDTTQADMFLVNESVEYFEDGSSITTQIYESPVSTYATTYTKEGSKSITYKNDSGTALWKYTVSGRFTVVSGTSSTCTLANGTPYIYDSSWSKDSNTVSRSGNKATGNITMQKKLLGIVVQTTSKTVTLTCSVDGVLS